ncbi:MAG: multifunctional 2',3'-cyclic-nucleotide 2'-phosphodiesterase/5'-nucleotidase/3'-nucleotidase, partial [Candidatus Marinimicrobia bacterium CG08_land_8_20_14_0_20_45_22]
MKKLFYPIILISVALTSTTFSQRTADYPESDYLKVEIIFTNDIHGGIDRSDATFINPDFPPKLGGGAVAGRYIFQQRELARKNGWGFLLLDAGDIYQGTPLGTLSEGESIIQYMNTVGYDAITTGNHDFDNGWKNLKKLSDSARFPFIAANLYRKSTGQLVEFVKPYIIKEIQGIK